MKTVWVYDDKAVGTITAVSPNSAAPTSVTVGGKSYMLSTSEAMYAVSDIGSYKKGDTVTLMLDRSGNAAYISGAESVSGVFYGVVLSSEKQAITSGGSATSVYAVKVACTDGVERTVFSKDNYSSEGKVVMVKYEKGEATITTLSTRSISGKFTVDSFAGKKLAENVKILDVSGTSYMVVYPERLKGFSLGSDGVLYYELNGSGEIEHLILSNATGDAASYVYLTGINEMVDGEGNTAGSIYTYIQNGVTKTENTDRVYLGAKYGGSTLNMKDGKLSSFTALKSSGVTAITQLQAVTNSKTYQFADNVQVYLRRDSSYQLVNLSEVLDSGKYSYTIWTDEAKIGNRVRIMIVTEK